MTSQEIRELRFKLDLTQSQFADKVAVSISTIKSWEGGINKPNPRAEYKLRTLAKDA